MEPLPNNSFTPKQQADIMQMIECALLGFKASINRELSLLNQLLQTPLPEPIPAQKNEKLLCESPIISKLDDNPNEFESSANTKPNSDKTKENSDPNSAKILTDETAKNIEKTKENFKITPQKTDFIQKNICQTATKSGIIKTAQKSFGQMTSTKLKEKSMFKSNHKIPTTEIKQKTKIINSSIKSVEIAEFKVPKENFHKIPLKRPPLKLYPKNSNEKKIN